MVMSSGGDLASPSFNQVNESGGQMINSNVFDTNSLASQSEMERVTRFNVNDTNNNINNNLNMS